MIFHEILKTGAGHILKEAPPYSGGGLWNCLALKAQYRTLFVILVPSRDGPPYQVNGLSKLHFSNREML